MRVYQARTLRDLVDFANENNLLRQDCFQVIKEDSGYTLIYFR